MKLPTFRPNRSTIKNDPFESVIPDLEGNAAKDLAPMTEPPLTQPPLPRPSQEPMKRPPMPQGRRKITVHLRPDLVERVKNAAYWNPRLTIASIAEAGILHALEQVEKEHGGPYPAREQELRGGRPIR